MSKKKSGDKKPKKVGKKEAKAGTFSPSPAPGITDQAEASESPESEIEDAGLALLRIHKQDAEVAAQWAHRARIDYKIEGPLIVSPDGDSWLQGRDEFGHAHFERFTKPEQPEETSGKDVPTPPAAPEFPNLGPIEGYHGFVGSYSGMLCGQLVIRDDEVDECGLLASNNVHQHQFDRQHVTLPIVPVLEGIGLEPAADPVLQNGNGQAMIHYTDPVTGAEKVKGYTRVTTYIDGLDDKTVLTKWKMRTLLEGAAVETRQIEAVLSGSTRIEQVARATLRLDAALADIDQREKVEGELLELRRQELLKEHRTLLEGIAEELMELGGAHEKANKGTDLHRLTELVDNGHPLPDDTTASDRRDVEAYSAKMTELGITTVWTERRVVLDDIQVSGTMDRAYQVRLPGMQRRIRVVGDLKTGSVSWGKGKIACQLALYSRGLGYDWTKPLERERLNLSKAHGLLVHLPQGEGICEVYLVDLELAAKGLALAAQVREWRREQNRAYDLKAPLRLP